MTTREVRAYGNTTIHRTTEPRHPGSRVNTVCGERVADSDEPRHWQSVDPTVLTECPACFAPAEPETFHVGDLVEFTEDRRPARNGDRGTIIEDVTYRTIGTPANRGMYRLRLTDGQTVTAYGRRLRLVDRPPAEPQVYRCDDDRHPGSGHYHVTNRDGALRWHSTPNLGRHNNEYTDVPGTFNRTATTPAPSQDVTERESSTMSQTYEVRSIGDRTIHRTTIADAFGVANVPSVCGRGLSSVSSHPREWTGRPGVILTECPACFAATEQQPDIVGTDLYPLTRGAVEALPVGTVLTLTSRARGTLAGSEVVFGCQRFSLDSLVTAEATLAFSHSGVSVTVDATTTRDGCLNVVDHTIVTNDINDYATSVVVKSVPAPPDPDAEVLAVLRTAIDSGRTMLFDQQRAQQYLSVIRSSGWNVTRS